MADYEKNIEVPKSDTNKRKMLKIFGIIFLVALVVFIVSWFNTSAMFVLLLVSWIAILVSCTVIWRNAAALGRKPTYQPSYSRNIPQAVKNEVWRRDMGRCTQCGGQERLEYDHIIPFSKGSNTARNIQLLCETCNRQKGANIETKSFHTRNSPYAVSLGDSGQKFCSECGSKVGGKFCENCGSQLRS